MKFTIKINTVFRTGGNYGLQGLTLKDTTKKIIKPMKTIKIDTGEGKVILTFSKETQKYDLFAGKKEAMEKLEKMCIDFGWQQDLNDSHFTSFVSENINKFVVVEKSKVKSANFLNGPQGLLNVKLKDGTSLTAKINEENN